MPVTILNQRTQAINRRSWAVWQGANVDGSDINSAGFQVLIQRVQFDLPEAGGFGRTTPWTVWIDRPKAAEGYVWNYGGESCAELVPIAELAHDGFSEFRIQGHLSYTIGGHIVAVSLTGPDESENLLSVSGAFNTQMGNVERRIRNASAFPQKIRIEVNSYYDDTVPPFPWIPKSVTYHFKEGHNSVSEAITQDLIGVQMTIPDSGGMTAVFGKAKLELEQASWSVDQADRRFQGATCLPPVQLRPYAFLDYIAFAKKGTYHGFQFDDRFLNYYLENVSRKAGFAKVDLDGAFRKTMLTANAAGHGTGPYLRRVRRPRLPLPDKGRARRPGEHRRPGQWRRHQRPGDRPHLPGESGRGQLLLERPAHQQVVQRGEAGQCPAVRVDARATEDPAVSGMGRVHPD